MKKRKKKKKNKRKDAEYIGYEFNKDNSDNDLKTEYEQAIKMINKELKQEKNNINENNIYNDENISLNISSVDNTLSQPIYCTKYNNKKNKIERTVLIRNKPKISFQRSATTNNGRKISSSKSKSKFLEQNQSINNTNSLK